MPTIILKTDVVDDPDPNTTPPAASRIFPVNFMDGGGQLSGAMTYRSRAVTGTVSKDAPSAPAGSVYDSTLYVKYGSTWVAAGTILKALTSDELASAFIGSPLSATMDGFLRQTGISATAGATGFVQTIYDATESLAFARNQRGYPQSGNAPVLSFKSFTKVLAPDGASVPASLTGGDHVYPEQYVLLVADGGNTDYIEILDSAAPGMVGSGIPLYAKGSLALNVYDAAAIFIHSPSAAQYLRFARF